MFIAGYSESAARSWVLRRARGEVRARAAGAAGVGALRGAAVATEAGQLAMTLVSRFKSVEP